MPVTVPGAMTKDGVPLDRLRTVLTEDIGFHREDLADLKGLFCEEGNDTTYDIATTSMQMRPIGDDNRPFRQHVDSFEIAIPAPKRYGVASAITAGAWERGLSSERIRMHATEALKADRKHVIGVIVDRIFATAGWYQAWMTPPPFQSFTHTSSHSHYLAYNVGGLLNVTIPSAAKLHITHHGGDGSKVVGWINSTQAAALEQFAEFDSSSTLMDNPIVTQLQRVGFQAAFPLAGVPHMINDWIPDNYACYLDFEQKPFYWRSDSEQERDLIIYEQETVPNAGTYWFGEYVRYSPDGGPAVVRPNAGVAVYLASGTYSAPTALIPTTP